MQTPRAGEKLRVDDDDEDDDDEDEDVELHVLGCRLTIWDRLSPMPKHGSMLLYVHGNRKTY